MLRRKKALPRDASLFTEPVEGTKAVECVVEASSGVSHCDFARMQWNYTGRGGPGARSLSLRPRRCAFQFSCDTTLLCQEVKSSQVKSPKHKGHTCVGWPGDRDNLLSTHAVTRVSVTCGGEEGL